MNIIDLEEEDIETLRKAETVLDYILGDTDGDGRDRCPCHGPPAFRAMRAIVELLTGNSDDLECTCYLPDDEESNEHY